MNTYTIWALWLAWLRYLRSGQDWHWHVHHFIVRGVGFAVGPASAVVAIFMLIGLYAWQVHRDAEKARRFE